MICAACAYSACIVIYESELRSVNNKNKKSFLIISALVLNLRGHL